MFVHFLKDSVMSEISLVERDGRKCIVFTGELTLHEVEKLAPRLKDLIQKSPQNSSILLDLSASEKMDTVGSGMLSMAHRIAERRHITLEVTGANESVQKVLDRFLWLETPVPKKLTIADWFEKKGDSILATKDRGIDFLQLVADTLIFSIFEDKRTRRVRKGAVWQEANEIGLGALGIICLLTLLIGLVVALQTASLLRMFGADILVADMLGISMVRELSPLMTSIIMAGRSGASIAAEIATMMINEEVAGIRTMGLDPVRYIVVPKFRAISLTMPGLTVFSIICGILGGFIIAIFYMGLSPSAFFHELSRAIYLKDVLVTLFKSLVFSWIIVLVAAQQGFSAYGGSDAVGRVTTRSVVLSIFWVIIADALFSIVFYF